MQITASKLEWLKTRPDKRLQTDEGQRFLKTLEDRYWTERTDPLMPWLAREWKKGRIQHPEREGFLVRRDVNGEAQYVVPPLTYAHPNNPSTVLTPPTLNHWADWYHSNHPTRRGVDIMQMQTPQMHEKIGEWDEALQAEMEASRAKEGAGQIVHRFPDDWTVRRLRNGDEAEIEGDKMGHCVGGYGHQIERGDTQIFSLRDPGNEPHTTMEIDQVDPRPAIIPEHVWNEVPRHNGVDINRLNDIHEYYNDRALQNKDPRFGDGITPDEDKAYDDLRETYGYPNLRHGNIVQSQGKSNATPLDEYRNRMDEFLAPHDLESFKPWWDDHYEENAPESIDELMDRENGEGNYEHEPDEYRNAMYEAEEAGVAEPELVDPSNIDWGDLVKSLHHRPYERSRYIWNPEEKGGRRVTFPAGEKDYDPEEGDTLHRYAENLERLPTPAEQERGYYYGMHNQDALYNLHGALKDHRDETIGDLENEWAAQHPQYQWPDPTSGPTPEWIEAHKQHYISENLPRNIADMYNHLGSKFDDWEPLPDGNPALLAVHPQQGQLSLGYPYREIEGPWYPTPERERVPGGMNYQNLNDLTASVHTSSKLEWLQQESQRPYDGPPDRRRINAPGGQALVNWFGHAVNWAPHADPLFPWLAREWKKGRLNYDPQNRVAPTYDHPDRASLATPYDLSTGVLTHWGDWYNSNHESRRNLGDIMKYPIQEIHDKVEEWNQHLREQAEQAKQAEAAGGHVVHTFPDNWTVRKLTDPDHLQFEGDAMGHCVGGYGNEAESGRTQIYSLRDNKHQPHVTAEIKPERFPMTVDGFAKLMDTRSSHSSVWRALPQNIKDDVLRMYSERNGQPFTREEEKTETSSGGDYMPKGIYNTALSSIPESERYEHSPTADNGILQQVQGKSNDVPKPEYQARMKDWFLTFPPETRPRWDPREKIDDIRKIRPEVDPDYDGQEDEGGYGPHGDYGLADQPIDYDHALSNTHRDDDAHGWRNGRTQYYPDEGRALYEEAKRRGEIPAFAYAVQRHNENVVMPSWNDLEDLNIDYLGSYPGEGWENDPDQWLEEAEERNHDRDYGGNGDWDELTPDERAREAQEIWQEQREEYDANLQHLQSEHELSGMSNHLYSLINPHYNPETQQYENEPWSGGQGGPDTITSHAQHDRDHARPASPGDGGSQGRHRAPQGERLSEGTADEADVGDDGRAVLGPWRTSGLRLAGRPQDTLRRRARRDERLGAAAAGWPDDDAAGGVYDVIDLFGDSASVNAVENPDEVYIDLIDVDPDTRGSGIGTRLMNAIRSYCDGTGKRLVVGRVVNQPFFSGLGWLHQRGPDQFVYQPPAAHTAVKQETCDRCLKPYEECECHGGADWAQDPIADPVRDLRPVYGAESLQEAPGTPWATIPEERWAWV